MQALNMGGSIKICKFPPPPKKYKIQVQLL